MFKPFRKYIYLISIALKHMAKNKGRALSIGLPLMLIIFIVSAMSFYRHGVKRDALLAVKHFPDILLQQQIGGRSESLFYDRYEDVLNQIQGIQAFFPRVWGYINFSDHNNNARAFVVMGLDPRYLDTGHLMDIAIERGRSLGVTDAASKRGIVGKALAESFDCSVGDTIRISTPNFKHTIPIEVIGIFDSSVQIYTADLLLVPIKTARKILGFLSEYESSDILIYLQNPKMADTISKEIVTKIEGARPLTKLTMENLTHQSFGQKSGLFHLLWFILLVNVVILAWSLMSQISFNLRKEIGILKAIGWDTGDIMALKSIETFITGAFGAVTGVILGILYMRFDAPGLKDFIIGWADVYPDFPIPLYIEWANVFILLALGIVPLLVGTIIPIWKIGIIDPDEAIRK